MANKIKPFYSIIIPALNEAKYLPHLLEDLTHQTYQDFEVIVVDGHSDDGTIAKTKQFSSLLPSLTVVNSPRRHVCAQRNLGAKHARAGWFIFMDADNRLPLYFLQGIKYRLESMPTDIATCWLKSDKDTVSDKNIAAIINLGIEAAKLSINPGFMESMVISSRSAFRQIGGFDESVNLSEGRVFLAKAQKLGLDYQIFRDPLYTYSFRRLRKFGTLKIASTLAKHLLNKLIDPSLAESKAKKLYPMLGGTLFLGKKSGKDGLNKNLLKFFQEFRQQFSLK